VALRLFIDFDGTIARADVGNTFFRTFGGERCTELVRAYRAGEISAEECFSRERELIGSASPSALEAFVQEQEITPGFPELIQFCRTHAIHCTIVSDGLDFYIRGVLARMGLHNLPVFSNMLAWRPEGDGRVLGSITFPHANAECDRCGCCKRNIVLNGSGEEDVIVYVGDGYSDRCPVEYADIVFAKDELQTYCQQNNISYYLFDSFVDVAARLAELLRRRTIRRRRRAEQRRREAFVAEA
jgi:2-hydroxy-3-keto-5-methylthiopentenyl-1-phosphate phosphatase